MTTAEMLAEVTAQIRKDIPRLMELREGCYLMNHTSNKVYKIINVDGEICFLADVNNYKLSLLEITKSTAENYFKIIGHDIMLNDVLEWVKFNAFNVEFQENGDFNLYGKLKMSKNIERYSFVNWNLSKPLLKDQSEGLIKFLYNLSVKSF